jgi:hypothetical protein
VAFGPVKGDPNLWFYDEVDIGPYLKQDRNVLYVTVLRFFYATKFATSFPRSSMGGLRVVPSDPSSPFAHAIRSSQSWEALVDERRTFRIDEPEDDFLHVYEQTIPPKSNKPKWTAARTLEFQTSTGNCTPWRLSPRLIPPLKLEKLYGSAIHNARSDIGVSEFETILLGKRKTSDSCEEIIFPAHTKHIVDIEMPHHTTGFIRLDFVRPTAPGGALRLQYAESYEETPILVPYLRRKHDRCDTRKEIYGPEDIYEFGGQQASKWDSLDPEVDQLEEESFVPFHFRSFRFLRLHIHTGPTVLTLKRFEVTSALYPLKVTAQFRASPDKLATQLWDTSIRTLNNCMHDCYEDCPFYEQLQYAMDTRSSALFTYYVSSDDRLAKQAIIQIHSSFEAHMGLTASRAPSHNRQYIPHFSLFWILMLHDHFKFFGESEFILKFMPVADAILNYFHCHIDKNLGLVFSDEQEGIWNFVDWAEEWRPYGIPPAVTKTGVSTYTNHLYAYALKTSAQLLWALGRTGLADEYLGRARLVVQSINEYCFDGEYYTDGLASNADKATDYSQHNQVWAVMSGAATGERSQRILRKCLSGESTNDFTQASISMSFYTLRALSEAGAGIYEEHYHRFWEPWKKQLSLGLTTWEEDTVSHRSDCHAWGSVPLHEFMAEVVGLRPEEPGWASISFEPRLELYSEVQATVPLRWRAGKADLLAHISWKPVSSISTLVHIEFDVPKSETLPVYIKLPYQRIHRVDTMSKLEYIVSKDAGANCSHGGKHTDLPLSRKCFPAESLEI